MHRLLVKDDDIELGEEKEERMLQIKERDQCIIHEEGILHNIRPRQSKAVAGRQAAHWLKKNIPVWFHFPVW